CDCGRVGLGLWEAKAVEGFGKEVVARVFDICGETPGQSRNESAQLGTRPLLRHTPITCFQGKTMRDACFCRRSYFAKRPRALVVGAPQNSLVTSGENMKRPSLCGVVVSSRNPATEHTEQGLHLNEVTPKRLPFSAGD